VKHFKKQDLEFTDTERLQRETLEILQSVSGGVPDRYRALNYVCMTQIPGDPKSAEVEAMLKGLYWTKPNSSSKEITEKDDLDESKYTEFCSKYTGTYFEEIHRELSKRWIIGRMKLMLLRPETCLARHRDHEPILDIAIQSNSDAFLVVDDEQFCIPVDGSVWLVDTTNYHTAYNSGETDRISLIVTYLGEKT